MKLLATVVALGGAVAFLGSCADRHSPAGFRLPEGNVARGQQAFLDLKCNACHRVSGLDLPAPTVEPPVPVVLGGEIPHVRTDGDLVTSIINPSHSIVPGFREGELEQEGRSRMLDYRNRMTVGQLVDLVAFLQSRYKVIRPGKS